MCYYGLQVNVFRSSQTFPILIVARLNMCGFNSLILLIIVVPSMHFTKNHNQRIACSSM
jgi:hypothetical protein